MKTLCFLFLLPFLSAFAEELPRIVSISPALTELVCALGRESLLAGRSNVCDYPPSVKQLPAVGKFAIPNVEKIIRLRPNLLLTNDLVNPNVRNPLEKAGVRVEIMPCRTIQEYLACVRKLGTLLRAEKAAEREIRRAESRMRGLAKNTARSLRVLWVVWDSPLLLAGAGSLPDEMIAAAGAVNAAHETPQAYFRASRDWILTHQPDVIVWMGTRNTDLRTDRFWRNLSAVRAGRVLANLDRDVMQRPGPRIFDALDVLRKHLKELP